MQSKLVDRAVSEQALWMAVERHHKQGSSVNYSQCRCVCVCACAVCVCVCVRECVCVRTCMYVSELHGLSQRDEVLTFDLRLVVRLH